MRIVKLFRNRSPILNLLPVEMILAILFALSASLFPEFKDFKYSNQSGFVLFCGFAVNSLTWDA